MILFTIMGILVAALIAFTLLYFLYVELEDRFLIRYCRKNLVHLPNSRNPICYKCGEINQNRIVARYKYGKYTNEWVCFHNCDLTVTL